MICVARNTLEGPIDIQYFTAAVEGAFAAARCQGLAKNPVEEGR